MQGLQRTLEMTIMIRALNQTTGAFSGVKLAALAAIGAIGAGLAYSVKQAADFQTGLTLLSTGAGEAASNLHMVGDGIKQISIDTATSTDQLLKGAFMIESAGYRGQAALDVLKVAAEGAKLENTDLGATANTLTSLLHDYGMASTQAAGAMSGLIQTEADGKMHMSDLVKAMGNVLPLASALKISFPEIGAAIAVMTNSGMTAMRATQNLNFLLRALAAPSSVGASEMQIVGISAQEVKDKLAGPDGLLSALTFIEDAIGKRFPQSSVEYTTALKDIMGGATGWNTALKLSGQHLQEMQSDINNISAAMNNGSTLQSKWAQIQQTFNFQFDQTKQALNVAAIDIGTVLIPVLEKALAWITPLIGQFTNWVQTSPDFQNAVNNVATAIGNLTQFVIGLVQNAFGLFQAFQQGQAGASALAFALVSVGAAFALMRIEATVTGITLLAIQLVQAATAAGGLGNIIWILVRQAFPALAATVADISTVTGIAETEIATALGVATAGISLVLGLVIAGIVQAAISGQTAIKNASASVQQSYNALGHSADDVAAKQKADAIEAQGQYNAMADNSSKGWHQAAAKMAQDSANLKAQMVLDAQRSADAWSQWIEYFHSQGIDPISGGKWDPTAGTKPGGPHAPPNPGTFPTITKTGTGGPGVPGHATGILNSPFGHMAALAERGSEWMYIPSPTTGYVPQGASVFPHGASPGGTTINITVSTMAGSRSEIMRMVDMIEQELAHRFRSQTSSFSLRGVF